MTLQWIVEVDWDKNGTYTDEGARAVKVQVKRGRDTLLTSGGMEPMAEGECVVTLDNHDGRYDPYNTGGALYGYLLPGRPFQLSVAEGGVTQPVLGGYLTDVRPLGRQRSEAVLKAADGIKFLGMQDCDAVTPQSNYLVASAIGDLLEMSAWPLASTEDTFPFTFPLSLGNTAIENNGDTIDSWTTDTGKSILKTIEEVAAAFTGTVYTTREGTIAYQARDTNRSTRATIDEADVLTDIETRAPWDEIYNDIRVTGATGAMQTASATASENEYGRRTLAIANNDYIQTAAQALDTANFLVLWAPEIKRGLRVRLEDQFDLQFGVELMDQVRVTMATLGVNSLYTVGKIEHEWQAGQGCTTRLTLEAYILGLLGLDMFPFEFPLTIGW